VNNAGGVNDQISSGLPATETIEEMPPDRWHQLIDLNLTGPFLMTRETLGVMKGQGSGSIANISSSVAQHGLVGYAAYAAEKAGLEKLTQTAPAESRTIWNPHEWDYGRCNHN
jgi:NAD(P)-dependent dehydrogenase (short-subunit alcohol dehydrogenase family)